MITAQEIHEIYNKVLSENDVLLRQAGLAVPRLTSWEDLTVERKALYEAMAVLFNERLAERREVDV